MTNTNQQLASNQYQQQLLDERWRMRRQQIIHRDGGCCRSCGSTIELQVHHRQYHTDAQTGIWKAPWNYEDRLLITLCRSCHEAGHQLYKVPVFEVRLQNEYACT